VPLRLTAAAPSQGAEAPGWFLPVLIPFLILITAFLIYVYVIRKR
jgi:hypothetical protein